MTDSFTLLSQLTYEQRNAVFVGESLANALAKLSLMHPSEVTDVMTIFQRYAPGDDESPLICKAYQLFMEGLIYMRDEAKGDES